MALLEARGVSFTYENGRRVFKDVSFSLDAGEIMSVIGPNGAGKSTLLNCLAGLLPLETGEILLNGRGQRSFSANELAQMIGYVPQNHIPVYSYSVREFVVMGRAPHIRTFASPSRRDYEIAGSAIESMQISDLEDRPYTEISGGERQKAIIARVLAQQPRIIMMDEPTSFLDYGNQTLTIRLVRRLASEGYAVVMTTHNPDHAIMLGGIVALMDNDGGFSAGSVDEIMREEILKRVYKTNLNLAYVESAGRKTCIPAF
ncbi:MAG: ABC transporter ATP-binding protein [Synergistaceae bacterium]|jgi:iron complex transport system ATP-binding protein|nr:ABC transporter ATP-binding protein [Synergistaceae bacterium]